MTAYTALVITGHNEGGLIWPEDFDPAVETGEMKPIKKRVETQYDVLPDPLPDILFPVCEVWDDSDPLVFQHYIVTTREDGLKPELDGGWVGASKMSPEFPLDTCLVWVRSSLPKLTDLHKDLQKLNPLFQVWGEPQLVEEE